MFFFFAGVTIHGLFRKVSTTDFNANQILESFTFGTVNVFTEYIISSTQIYCSDVPVLFMARKNSNMYYK